MHIRLMAVILVAASAGSAGLAQRDAGLVGHWTFDEGDGDVTGDLSGQGNDGRLHGPTWVQRGEGHALAFNGVDDYVDCGAGAGLDLREAVSLEAWVQPLAVPAGEPLIAGKSTGSYALTMYKDGQCWWYISSGGNNLKAPVEVGAWNHIVGTFDGSTMALYVNGERVGSRQSQFEEIAQGGRLSMGAVVGGAGVPTGPHFQGLIDDLRVYSRALAPEEIQTRYKHTAGGYGTDTTWFDRLRAVPYRFRDRQRLLVLYDYRGVFPRPDDARLEARLLSAGGEALQVQEFAPLPACGKVAAQFALADLPPGEYRVEAALTAPDGLSVTSALEIHYPFGELHAPPPAEAVVPPLPEAPGPAAYDLQVHPGGGFTVQAAGRRLPVESFFSYPGGGENRLLAGQPDAEGQDGWQVKTRQLAEDAWEVSAGGPDYGILRRIHRRETRIEVRDTIRNLTDEVLGVIIDNRLDARADPFTDWAVAGHPNAIERRHSHSQSVFVAWDELGVGMLPLDDVYIVHGTMYARDGRAGMADDMFGLAPGASYTLDWAVYPCGRGDYWDFINAVRRDEGRNGTTIEGGFAFISREGVSEEYVELRNLRYGSFGCLTHVADDPQIEIEGIEFIHLPKERARLRRQFAAIRAQHPHLKLMFHIAHSLFSTNRPAELFPDSRVVDANGNQVTYSHDYANSPYFSRQRYEEGWRWYIFYPTPGNSFHDAMMRAADMLIDDIGCDGAFMDGFMLGYGSPWTHDRWDGHTVRIDPETKTVTRRVGSVLLLSQPSMVEFTRRMTDRGAVIVANSPVVTRTVGALPLIVDQECIAGPNVHLAQTSASLGNPSRINSEADVYRDVLDKLQWANLYFYYGEGELTYPSLPQQMYPITIEELRSGTVKGEERIVTMRSGVYGWKGDRHLHLGYRYNALGMPVPAELVTRVDADGVRTLVELDREESAVIRRIPVSAETERPASVICAGYDHQAMVLAANGTGRLTLRIADGDFHVRPNAPYRVTAGETMIVRSDADGVLEVALALTGATRVVIEPAG
ncbi:MAG: LamG domain-containing protein [Armatimonadota bacterium]|nr:LamG domain-containing protein [Armatimonadota bacterium]